MLNMNYELLLRLMLLLLSMHLEIINELKINNLKNVYPENIRKVKVGYRILEITIYSKQIFE